MQKVFDITSIRQKYPNRWLLLIIYSYEDEQPTIWIFLTDTGYVKHFLHNAPLLTTLKD
jgi:hypothetical protein